METAKVKETELERMERKFVQLAQEIYEAGERRIQPTWPWLLIRLCPKEQRFGSLYLPDNSGAQQQNKPLAEGIVLEIWKPHWSKVKQIADGNSFRSERKQSEIWRESDFKRGDRVLFPHFAGVPTNFLDAQNYRLIREWTFDPNGGAFGLVRYAGDRKYKPVLDELFDGLQSVTLSGK